MHAPRQRVLHSNACTAHLAAQLPSSNTEAGMRSTNKATVSSTPTLAASCIQHKSESSSSSDAQSWRHHAGCSASCTAHLATNLATLHATNRLLLVGCNEAGVGKGAARQGMSGLAYDALLSSRHVV